MDFTRLEENQTQECWRLTLDPSSIYSSAGSSQLVLIWITVSGLEGIARAPAGHVSCHCEDDFSFERSRCSNQANMQSLLSRLIAAS